MVKLFVESGLVVLSCFISPFRAERQMVREMLEDGEFIEIFVDVPLEECIRRDPKGLYRKAQAGQIKNFTGIDSPYEAPDAPDIHIQHASESADRAARRIADWFTEFQLRKLELDHRPSGVRTPPQASRICW
jgi:bifunctional enzyme CysN/CysC